MRRRVLSVMLLLIVLLALNLMSVGSQEGTITEGETPGYSGAADAPPAIATLGAVPLDEAFVLPTATITPDNLHPPAESGGGLGSMTYEELISQFDPNTFAVYQYNIDGYSPGRLGRVIYAYDGPDNDPLNLPQNYRFGSPEISPNGIYVASSCYQNTIPLYEDICILNLQTQRVFRATNDVATDRNPTWSPDGTQIAFDSERFGSQFQIWRADINFSQMTATNIRLVSTQACEAPTWGFPNIICMSHSPNGLSSINPITGAVTSFALGLHSHLDSVLVDNDSNGTWDDSVVVYSYSPPGETRRTTGWASQNGTIPGGFIPLPSAIDYPQFERLPETVGVNGRFVLSRVRTCIPSPLTPNCPVELRIAGVGNNAGYGEQLFPHIPVSSSIDLASGVQTFWQQTQLAPTVTPMPLTRTAIALQTQAAQGTATALATAQAGDCSGNAFRASRLRNDPSITGLQAHERAPKLDSPLDSSEGATGHTIRRHVLSSTITSDYLKSQVNAVHRRASAFNSVSIAEEWIGRILEYLVDNPTLTTDVCRWLNDANSATCEEFSANYIQIGYTPPTPIGVGWVWNLVDEIADPGRVRGVYVMLCKAVSVIVGSADPAYIVLKAYPLI